MPIVVTTSSTVTALDIVTRAMRAIQALGSGEVPSANEATDGLIALNAMLDSWSNDGLASYRSVENSFPLTVGTSSYTVGSGGTVNVVRPLDITQAYIQDTGGNNYDMTILPRDKWNQIGNRSSTITSQIPSVLFYDPQFPLGVINVFPTPLIAYTCFFDGTLDQTTFSALTTLLAMPAGYERAYVSNLAMEMVLLGFETTLDQKQLAMLADVASKSLASIKSTNITEQVSDYDPALVSRAKSTYNIYRDSGGG